MSGFARKMKRQAVGYTPTPREARMLQALQSAAHVLKQYADGSNWADTTRGSLWVGEGDGPDLARMSLGVKAKPKQEEKTTEDQ
jgi:hypothetical protein